MDDRKRLLQRTSLKELGKFLMDTDGIYEEELDADDMTAEERREQLRDNLEVAMWDDISEETRRQLKEAADETWAYGKRFGFMEGMRAGARIVLTLLGDGEILI